MKSGVNLHFLQNDHHCAVTEARWQHWNTHQWSEFIHRPRPRFGILLVLEGRMDYQWEGGSLTLTAGDLGFLPKGCCYDVHFRTDLGKVESAIVNFQADHDGMGVPIRIARNCISYKPLFDQLIEAFEQEQPFRTKGQFYLLLHQLTLKQKSLQEMLLEQAISLLEQELPMKQIALRCGISESSLRRLFVKQMGQSPVAYRTHLKLQKACRLLTSTDQTVQQIADALGFYDEAYFCKVFAKKMGTSPALYRKNHQIIL